MLFQLRFRYDREIDNCVRPALKRILESDDSPARPLILCVAAITKKMVGVLFVQPCSAVQRLNV